MGIIDSVAAIPTTANLSIKLKEAETIIASLQQENTNLKSSVDEKDDKIRCLEKQIIEIQNNPLTFDENTGTWISTINSLRYGAKCKSQNISSPLKNGSHSWKCPVCNTSYPDPSRPQQLTERWRPSDPGVGY
jgi:hypothetical protein